MSCLHTWRHPSDEVRVRVSRWIVTEPITDQFLEPERSSRLLLNYLRRVGVRAVVRKVRSRLAETRRNAKVFGLGEGLVTEAPVERQDLLNQRVLFLATNHDPTHTSVVLHHRLVRPMACGASWASVPSCLHIPAGLARCRAWSPHSGIPLDFGGIQSVLGQYAAPVHAEPIPATALSGEAPRVFRPAALTPTRHKKPTAVLFGLGNYAKTAIIPNISDHLTLQRVHEVDPEQIQSLIYHKSLELCTTPVPYDARCFDAWFIAGFHHTHSELALSAFDQGAVAVIEKPIAVNQSQYESFLQRISGRPGSRFFACFHKRYSALHDFVHVDLRSTLGDPIDMHCVVYEIPLPTHHWYNWPNSGSRLISNGCHWIDYFMFVNDYSLVADSRRWRPRGADEVVQLRLNNGAYFSMTLTDSGSQRLGVRDHIELRHGGTTVTITDGSRYVAEDRRRIIRRASCNPLDAYARMYRSIARAITYGERGDDVKTLRSTDATLRLEELSGI